MPNNGHYTICPFFQRESGKTIVCEDCPRRFRTKGDKLNYMKQFCDSNYEACIYAQELQEVWEATQRNPAKGMQIFLDHQVRAQEKEIKILSSRLDRLERK